MAVADDRTTRARIRDAAIACFAEHGRRATTARLVADRAGVSPGSVIHHFATMDGLRRACDEHVMATIRRAKLEGAEQGLGMDVTAALRSGPGVPWLTGYLARMLLDDEASGPLVDEIVDDAETYLERAVATGQVRPSRDPRRRAVILTLQALVPLVLHEHLERLIGVDLTDAEPSAADRMAYARPVLELYAEGLFTDEFVAANTGLLDTAPDDTAPDDTDPPTPSEADHG